MKTRKQKSRNRADGEGSVYFDNDRGKWVAVVTVGYDASGKRIRRKRTASRRADAAALLKQLIREYGTAAARAASPRTVGIWLDGWLKDVNASKAAATYDSYRFAVEGHIKPHLGSVSLEKLQPIHVQRWLTSLADVGSRTRQNAFKVLRVALNDAVKLQVLAANPMVGFEIPTHQRKPIEPFTSDEAALIIDSFVGSTWHLYVLLGFGAGLRQGEILGLQWGDLRGDTLKIQRQQVESAGVVRITEPKSASGRRDVPIPSGLIDAWKSSRAAALTGGRGSSTDFVFVGPRGGQMRRSNFRSRHWQPTLAALDIEYRTPHQMRHTYATLSLADGVPITVVSRALGHSKTSITLDVYGHAMPDGINQLREFAGKLIG